MGMRHPIYIIYNHCPLSTIIIVIVHTWYNNHTHVHCKMSRSTPLGSHRKMNHGAANNSLHSDMDLLHMSHKLQKSGGKSIAWLMKKYVIWCYNIFYLFIFILNGGAQYLWL